MARFPDAQLVAARQIVQQSEEDGLKNKLQDYEATIRALRQAMLKLPQKLDPTNDTELWELLSEIGWYGPLTYILGIKGIQEIMVNAPDKKILVTKNGITKSLDVTLSVDWIRFTVARLRQKRGLSDKLPGRYTGSLTSPPIRYTYVSSSLSVSGDMLYIRVLPRNPMSWGDLVASEMVTRELAKFIDAMVKIRVNILISGSSGAGKTTLATTMGTSIPKAERVIAVEGEHEIHLNAVLPNFTAFELNPEIPGTTLSDLLRHVGLKVAPSRIYVGEVRGGEAFDLMQAMNTGLDGSMATIHANSPRDGLKKFADYVLMSGTPMPPETVYSRIADARPMVIQVSRLPDGRRVVSDIAECLSATGSIFEVADLYTLNQEKIAVRTKVPPSEHLAQRLAAQKISLRM